MRDMIVILMVYDFVYYLTHRFLFHDNGIFGGPLKWMHAIHHRQHNPCKGDSSYIHPLEVAIGLGLYVATIFFLSIFFGNFHVLTIIVTWFAFSGINTHNHACGRIASCCSASLPMPRGCTTIITPASPAAIMRRSRCFTTGCLARSIMGKAGGRKTLSQIMDILTNFVIAS